MTCTHILTKFEMAAVTRTSNPRTEAAAPQFDDCSQGGQPPHVEQKVHEGMPMSPKCMKMGVKNLHSSPW